MGWKVALYLGIPTVLSGCNIVSYAAHNLVNEPAQEINQLKLRQRMNTEARAAWKEECSRHPAGTYSGAYADGFIGGYADYLDNGGTPGQPGAPPPRYRRHASDFTPTGQVAQKDYLAGFQHGAEAAAAGGGRQNVVVAINLPAPRPEQPLNITCVAAPPGESPPTLKPPMMVPPSVPGVTVPGPDALRLSDPKAVHPAPLRSASLGVPQALTAAPPSAPAPGSPPQQSSVIPAGGDRAGSIGGR